MTLRQYDTQEDNVKKRKTQSMPHHNIVVDTHMIVRTITEIKVGDELFLLVHWIKTVSLYWVHSTKFPRRLDEEIHILIVEQ